MKIKRYHKMLICFFITIFMSSATCINVSAEIKNNDKNKCFIDVAELPEWSIENFWVYDMIFDFTDPGTFNIEGIIRDLKLVVVDINETSDKYTLNITGKIDAVLTIFDIIPAGRYNADISGTTHIKKSTLAIEDFQFFGSGEYTIFHTDITIYMDFTPPFDFFDFPIEPDEDPWNANTYGRIIGHIKVDSIYEKDFGTQGPFEDETISFVKKEEITVPGGSFDSYLISGSTGPGSGGESKLWYSPEAGYLVKIREKIINWAGIDATLDMPLKATNYNPGNRPPKKIDVLIHELDNIDELDYWPYGEPEWYYTIKVVSGDNIQYQSNYNTDDGTYNGNWINDGQNKWAPNKHHEFVVYSRYVTVEIQLMDYDGFWEGGQDDVADISSDVARRTFIGVYDLADNKFIGIGGATDYMEMQDDWYYTGGELLPDNSTNADEDDSYVLFAVSDDYESPQIPDTPSGPIKGKVGVEYKFYTSTTDQENDEVYYKWDWGDETFSDWLGPFNSSATAEASHTWSARGTYEIKVKVKDAYAESNWSNPLSAKMPRSRIITNTIFFKFLEKISDRFPHAFPIMRELLKS